MKTNGKASTGRKLGCVILALFLTVSMLPMTVFADDNGSDPANQIVLDEAGDGGKAISAGRATVIGSTGKVTVAKGLTSGKTYTLKVNTRIAATANCKVTKAKTFTITITIK